VLNEETLENVRPGGSFSIDDKRLDYLTAKALPAQHYGGAVRGSRSTAATSRSR
jgi:hypothetical protein